MRHSMKFASAALLVALAAAKPALSRTELSVVGSSGTAFKDECPAGQYLVGLNARRSEYVDQVQIICAAIGAGGKFGEELYYGPERGGRTGTPLESACRGGTIIEAELAMSPSNRQISNVQLKCRSLLNGSTNTLSFSRNLGGGAMRGIGMQYLQECPDGEVATGIRGRADDYVGALGFICDTFVLSGTAGGGGGAAASLGEQGDALNRTLFADWFETESSLGGKFDIKLEITDVDEKSQRYIVGGTLRNTDIGPQYNGTFRGTMSPNQIGIVQLTYGQPAAAAKGSVVFTFSPDGETVTGDGIHEGHLPFKWNGRRKPAN